MSPFHRCSFKDSQPPWPLTGPVTKLSVLRVSSMSLHFQRQLREEPVFLLYHIKGPVLGLAVFVLLDFKRLRTNTGIF